MQQSRRMTQWKKIYISNKTLTDSIASLQAHNLRIIKLVKKQIVGTTVVTNPSTAYKPRWVWTRYCWSHGYKIRTENNSTTSTTINPGKDTKEKQGDTKGGATWNDRWVTKIWSGSPVGNDLKLETNNLVNKLISNPDCTNPNNIHTTALIYSSANVTLLHELAPKNTEDIQLDNKIIM